MDKNTQMNNHIFGNPAILSRLMMEALKVHPPAIFKEMPFEHIMASFMAKFDNLVSIECAQLFLADNDKSFLGLTSLGLQTLIDDQERNLKCIVFVKDKFEKSFASTYAKNSVLRYENNDSKYVYSLIPTTDISRILLELENKKYLITEDINYLDDSHIEILRKAISLNQIGRPNLHPEYQLTDYMYMGLKHLLVFNNGLIAFTIFKWLRDIYDLGTLEIQDYAHGMNLYAEFDIELEMAHNESHPTSKGLYDRLNSKLPGIKSSSVRNKI